MFFSYFPSNLLTFLPLGLMFPGTYSSVRIVRGATLDRALDLGSAGRRVSSEDEDIHPATRLELKFLTLQGIKPRPPGWKTGICRIRHGGI